MIKYNTISNEKESKIWINIYIAEEDQKLRGKDYLDKKNEIKQFLLHH
jgi:hypothetical protein